MNTESFKNSILATGVGSLPHINSKEAVDFVFNELKCGIPFWPQLPRSSFFENMYVQFCEKFPGIVIDEKLKTVSVDTSRKSYIHELEECLCKIEASDEDYFGISRGFAECLYGVGERLDALNWQGWVKAQLIGPFSLGLSLLDESKNPVLYNSELSELMPLFLALKAKWLINFLRKSTKRKIIIFVDEPYLVAVGSSQCGLSKEAIAEKINCVVDAIHEDGAMAGLHCCGNTDWDMVMSTKIDILNFDAFGYFDKLLLYSSSLKAFLKRGGLLALGIVPTSKEELALVSTDKLFDLVKDKIDFFKNGAFITTSCGCSGLSLDEALRAHKMCVELSGMIKKII